MKEKLLSVSMLKENYNEVANYLEDMIRQDIEGGKIIPFVDAWNRFVEDEKDGHNYIFNLDNKDDLKYLVSNELISVKEIVELNKKESHFFFLDYGNNSLNSIPMFKTIYDIDVYLKACTYSIARHILTYPTGANGELYRFYISDILYENKFNES